MLKGKGQRAKGEARKGKEDEDMRLLGVLGVLCLVGTSAFGGVDTYTFEITDGLLGLSIQDAPGATSSALVGTFTVTVDGSDGHIGVSDNLCMVDADFANETVMKLTLAGLATATIEPGDARIVEFIQPTPAHIGPGGVVDPFEADAHLQVTVGVTLGDEVQDPLLEDLWASDSGELLQISMIIDTSGVVSDIITASFAFSLSYEVGIEGIATLTLDLVMQVEGTTQVPDPAFGGLTALGMAGAGAWLRKRRS